MKINSISNVQLFNYSSRAQKSPKLNYLASDVFVRTNPSFSGEKEISELSFEKFSQWAQQSGYLSSVQDNAENAKGQLLGYGFEGAVFEIPNCKNWVLKEYHRSRILPIKRDKAGIRQIEDIIPYMNIGQTIASLEIPSGPNYSCVYYIRKRHEGVEIGVKPGSSDSISNQDVKQYIDSLKLISEAPQAAYDRLIKEINDIYEAGYELDCSNSNNFLYDINEQQINIIDVNDRRKSENNQFGDVLSALLNTDFYSNLLVTPEYNSLQARIKEYSSKIISKFLNAMKKANLKFNDGYYFNKLLATDLFDTYLKSGSGEERINALKSENLFNEN